MVGAGALQSRISLSELEASGLFRYLSLFIEKPGSGYFAGGDIGRMVGRSDSGDLSQIIESSQPGRP